MTGPGPFRAKLLELLQRRAPRRYLALLLLALVAGCAARAVIAPTISERVIVYTNTDSQPVSIIVQVQPRSTVRIEFVTASRLDP
jgi:hypothetical protein